MKVRTVAAMEIDSTGQLFVRPTSNPEGTYEHIYREANGLRWDRERRAFCAREPARWQPEELYQHLADTLRNALGEELQLTEDTVWIDVPQELRSKLLAR